MENPVNRAIWYIESHYRENITLDDVARVAGLSKYHLVRVFAIVTNCSVMRYVRARRLSEAARQVLQGDDNIVTIALDAGYGSHAAFTRAFREQFGTTPENIRKVREFSLEKIMEPLKMDETPLEKLVEPRFETGRTFMIAGLKRRYDDNTSAAIPAQWQEFHEFIGHIPGQVGGDTYGVCCNSDDDGYIDYISGVEVSSLSDLPGELSGLNILPQSYAVFSYPGHVSEIRRCWYSIYNHWLPASGYELVTAPDFEHYSASFDPVAGTGGIEIWVPVKKVV